MSATVGGPTSHVDGPDLRTLAEHDPLAVMRACHDRRLEREGIPMLLGLADERGEIPPASGHQRSEGTRLHDVLEHYREVLVPWARDDDEGALITVMQVLGVTHLVPEPSPLVDEAVHVATDRLETSPAAAAEEADR